jgi:hypothetical protein
MIRAALLFLSLALASGTWAQPPEAPKPAAAKPAAKAEKKKKAASSSRPAWAELSADQQQILAPLKPDWDSLEPERKRKWIGIAKRYPKMKPEGQARVQRRMQDWAKLTPEQRRQARENYRAIAKERRDKKNLREQWAEYQSLPPSERESLVQEPVKPAPAPRKKKQ